MKKKLAAMILTLALAAGVMAPVPAYADGITVEETSMDTATEKSFDTDYTVKWDADKVYWNKVTLDQHVKARVMQPDGTYEKLDKRGKVLINSQEQFCAEAKAAVPDQNPGNNQRLFIPAEPAE